MFNCCAKSNRKAHSVVIMKVARIIMCLHDYSTVFNVVVLLFNYKKNYGTSVQAFPANPDLTWSLVVSLVADKNALEFNKYDLKQLNIINS